MSPEIWTIVGVGVAIAGLTLNSLRLLRVDLTAPMNSLGERMNRLHERMNRLDERMDRDKQELHEWITRIERGQGDLRERMAHLEGLLDGLREAITRNHAA